jgi:polar amino acid transport system substrate-binding protein
MRSIVKPFAAFCLAWTLAAHGLASASDLSPVRVVTEEFPPYNYTENGRLTGVSTEIVEALLRELGMELDIKSMPWARAYELARDTPNVLVYSITRTPQRESLFKWVGVVAPGDWHLYSAGDSTIRLSNLSEAKRFQVATVNEDAGEQYLIANGFSKGASLQSSARYELNYSKLRARRVDLWIANRLVARHLARSAGDDPDITLRHVLELPDLGHDGFYIAFGSQTSDAVVERFRRALDKLRRNGVYDSIQRKWL